MCMVSVILCVVVEWPSVRPKAFIHVVGMMVIFQMGGACTIDVLRYNDKTKMAIIRTPSK